MSARVGQGLDVHAFARNAARPLLLGGVEIAEGPGLAGHSDGDVVLHALVDGLLGAAGLGDLGGLVGVDRPETADASSGGFVEAAVDAVGATGWVVANADLTIVAQRPRIDPHKAVIRDRVAALLGAWPEQVSVKATSTDGLGAVGHGEGIACLAVVLLERRPSQ